MKEKNVDNGVEKVGYDIAQWFMLKARHNQKKGKNFEIVSLVPEPNNSQFLAETLKKMIEEGYEVGIPKKIAENLDDEENFKKFDRLFTIKINQELMATLYKKAVKTYKMAEDNYKKVEEHKDVLPPEELENAKKLKDEAKEYLKYTHKLVEDYNDNATSYMSDGTIIHNAVEPNDMTKEEILKTIDEIPLAKDDENENILSASKLLKKLDNLLVQIDAQIHKVDMLLSKHLENTQQQVANTSKDEEKDEKLEDMLEKIKEEEKAKREDEADKKLFSKARELDENKDKIISKETAKELLKNKEVVENATTLPDVNKNIEPEIDLSELENIDKKASRKTNYEAKKIIVLKNMVK